VPLTSGSRLGPYEILSPIGAGGMGEVYRARDSRLNRDVAIAAIKALPDLGETTHRKVVLQPAGPRSGSTLLRRRANVCPGW